jgi:hypothetical protein
MCCVISEDKEKKVPVTVVNLCLCTKQLLLTSLVGKVTTDLITVFFCLQHRDQVDARPHLFASEFAVWESKVLVESSIASVSEVCRGRKVC